MESKEQLLDKIDKHDPTITKFVFKPGELTASAAVILLAALQTNSYLTSLKIQNNSSSIRGIINNLAQALFLTHLDISSNRFSSEWLQLFANNTKLSSLVISNTQIKDDGVKILATLSTLTSLESANNSMSAEGIHALTQLPLLRALKIGLQVINVSGMTAISNNSRLRSLSVTASSLGPQEAMILAQNTRLTELDVSFNTDIRSQFISALINNTSLVHLDLSGLRMTSFVIDDIAKHTNLTSIGLAYCKIEDTYIATLSRNSNLMRLNLSDNWITTTGATTLASNTHLTDLDLGKNRKLGDKGALAFVNNTTLTSLDLLETHLTNQGVIALTQNYTLTMLNLRGNTIDANVLQEANRAIMLNKKAKELQFVEQVIEVAKGNRQSDQNPSLLKILPGHILLIILAYLAHNTLGKPEAVTNLCRFIFANIKRSGKLEWRLGDGKITFFKVWNEEERKEVELRFAKQPAATNVVVLN